MRALLVALLLAGSSTGQQPYHSTVNTMAGAANKPVFQFTAPSAGAYASLTAATGQTITCTRASTATYIDGTGTRQTAASNTCVVESVNGNTPGPGGTPELRSEGAATQVLLNNTAPATQTATISATGSWTGWMEGTGSVAFALGTATGTGFPCTATSASDCHFSITATGTVTATVSGTVTTESLESNPWRTSLVTTGGTAATRSADSDSFPKPAAVTISGGNYCATVVAALEGVGTSTQAVLGSSSNYAPLIDAVHGGASVYYYSDTAAGTPAIYSYSGQTASTKYRVQKIGTALSMWVAATAATAGTASTQPTEPTAIYLGGHNGARQAYGWIQSASLGAVGTCR